MANQAYKVFIIHAHEISGWKILPRLLHWCSPHLGGMDGDVQSDIATLAFKNWEQLEDFHIKTLRLHQEIIISVETVSPTRLLLQYTKEFPTSDKLKSSISPKMTYLLTFLDNNTKSAVQTGGNINGLYCYLDIIGDPKTLTTSGQRFHCFGC